MCKRTWHNSLSGRCVGISKNKEWAEVGLPGGSGDLLLLWGGHQGPR